MIGRRVAVVFRGARLTRPATAFHHNLPLPPLIAQSHRFYATPGRPKSVVGEPSRPVKRSVKKAATKATASETPAKEEVKSKKKKAAAAKKSAVSKKKKAAAAAAVKVKKKKKPAEKELTEEQVALKAARAERRAARTKAEQVKALKKLALKPPPVRKYSAWTLFNGEKVKEDLKGVKGAELKSKLQESVRRNSAEFKAMSPADLEHYNHLAHSALDESRAAFKKWVESHTPDQIAEANKARKQLRRKAETERKKGQRSAWENIDDERAVKLPLNAYMTFNINRQKSPDFHNIPFRDRSKLVSEEWKRLSQEEKNKYQRLHDQDVKRYVNEYSSTYGHPPPFMDKPQAAAAAAA